MPFVKRGLAQIWPGAITMDAFAPSARCQKQHRNRKIKSNTLTCCSVPIRRPTVSHGRTGTKLHRTYRSGSETQPPKPQKPSNKDLQYDYDKTLGFLGEAEGSFASDENEWMRAGSTDALSQSAD